MKIRFLNYDTILINTSAGKDSQAMTDVICRRAAIEGLIDRVVAVHCDLGEEEWAGSKELAEEHARFYGIRFETVKRKQGGIRQHTLDRHEKLKADGRTDVAPWPSSEQRWCTSDLKRGQVSTLLTKLAKEHQAAGRRGPCRILNCMGMRAAESTTRTQLKPFKLDKRESNGRRRVHTWLPIFEWSLEQVWECNRAAGTRHHPAYDLGMPRLSCCFCIYASRDALLLAGKHNRPLLDSYVKVEEKVGFAFRKELSLVSIRDALDAGEEPGKIMTWEGL